MIIKSTSERLSLPALQSGYPPAGRRPVWAAGLPGDRGDGGPAGKVLLQRHLGNVVLIVGGDLGRSGAVIPNISVNENAFFLFF